MSLTKQITKIQSVFRKPEHEIEIINIDDNVVFIDGDSVRRGVLVDVMGDFGRIEYSNADGSKAHTWTTADKAWKLRGTQTEIDALPHFHRITYSPAFNSQRGYGDIVHGR